MGAMAAAPIHRRNTAIVALVFYLVTLPFLILVSIGNTHVNPVLNSIYFFKLDVAQIIPISVANSNLLNSVARSLGLHDFYSVGLWSFCEGYLEECVDPSLPLALAPTLVADTRVTSTEASRTAPIPRASSGSTQSRCSQANSFRAPPSPSPARSRRYSNSSG